MTKRRLGFAIWGLVGYIRFVRASRVRVHLLSELNQIATSCESCYAFLPRVPRYSLGIRKPLLKRHLLQSRQDMN